MKQGILTVLGCGGSAGVPRIGNDWGDCDPAEPRNARTRASIAIQAMGETVIVDTGPDFRAQLNRENIASVSAVFYTHTHSDHVNGIDDLRPMRNRTNHRIPVYGTSNVIAYLQQRFDYMFETRMPYYPSALEPREWKDEEIGQGQFFSDLSYTPFVQNHETISTLGFRFGDVAYSTDMVDLDDHAISVLRGVKVWIADGNNLYVPGKPGPHANLERLIELNRKIGAEKVFVTHMKNNLDYRTLRRTLPEGFSCAFDGLKIRLDGTVLSDDAGF